MEKVTGIGGVFFRSENPEELSRWYTEHLGIDIETSGWQQEVGPTAFVPFKDDDGYFGRPDQQWLVNLRVRDLDAMAAQLEAAGIEVAMNPEWDSEAGRFARITDPEGNPIELWEPSGDMFRAARRDEV